MTSLKSNMYTVLSTQTTTTNNCVTHTHTNTHTHTHKHDCLLAKGIFKWKISVTGHKQETVALPQREPLSRSNVNYTVSVCSYVIKQAGPKCQFCEMFFAGIRPRCRLPWIMCLCYSSVLLGKGLDSVSNQPIIASFLILANPLFTDHPTIWRWVNWLIESLVK